MVSRGEPTASSTASSLALAGGRGRGPRGTERRRESRPSSVPWRVSSATTPATSSSTVVRSRPGRATPLRGTLALVSSDDEGAGALTVRERVALGRYPHRGPFRPLDGRRRGRRGARPRTDRDPRACESTPRDPFGRRAAARRPRPRPGPGAPRAAPRRARRPPRRRPSAPALPRPGRRARLRRRRSWPSSTTSSAPRPGRTAWCFSRRDG